MKITTEKFGLGSDLITFENEQGVAISFTNYGARIARWQIPTATGKKNIIWSFENADEYQAIDSYPGATIGRTAGRITDGQSKIDHQILLTAQNDGNNTLHGGFNSFDQKLWNYVITDNGIVFTLVSADGENGYPGELTLEVNYTYDEENRWTITYKAVSSKDTLFNPTNHVYFNLTGDVTRPIDEHFLKINAKGFALLNDQTLPTGEIKSFSESELSLDKGQKMSEVFISNEPQVKLANGLDHPFFLKNPSLEEVQAELSYKDLKVSVFTDRPAIVCFSVNFDEAGLEHYQGKLGLHGAITFETQVAPGAERFPEFGNILLKAGETFRSTTVYKLN